MYREWSIADGPADLTKQDVGKQCTFTIKRVSNKLAYALIDIEFVGPMHRGPTHSFSGRLHYNRSIFPVTGYYNTADHTGSCHTTDA